jgi:hypothetical protein
MVQLQLNINDFKANLFLEVLEVFKKNNIVNNYKILNMYNENEAINDLQDIPNADTIKAIDIEPIYPDDQDYQLIQEVKNEDTISLDEFMKL